MKFSLENLGLLEYLILASVIVYGIFTYFDRKVVKDEREEMIRLKALEMVSGIQGWTIFGLVIYMNFFKILTSMQLIAIMIAISYYAEIFGELYFRRKY